MNNMCVWATKWKTRHNESSFYEEMSSEWNLGSSSEIIVSLDDFNEHVGKYAKVLKMYVGEWYWVKKCRRKKIARVQ